MSTCIECGAAVSITPRPPAKPICVACSDEHRMREEILKRRKQVQELRAQLAEAQQKRELDRLELRAVRKRMRKAEHRAALVESEHTSECDGFNCAYCNFMRVAGELNEKDRELEALRPHIAVIAAESDGLYDAFKHRKAMEAFKKHLAAAPAEEDWCGKLIPWAEKICGLRAGHDGRCTAAPADGEPT